MSQTLHVVGFDADTTTECLTAAFAEFRDVSNARIVTDSLSGASREFGFVTFASDVASAKAIARMSRSDLGGSELTVDVAGARGSPKNLFDH